MDDELPFHCHVPKCGKRFTNEDHLTVHSKTHEMSLVLNTEKSNNSPAHPFVDQTPTPTKILKNFEEIGLFQELSKNPFDDAYKKALDSEVAPLPGPQSNELNTPTLIISDSSRHVSTSSAAGPSAFQAVFDKIKGSTVSADKLKPSPLAKEAVTTSKKSTGKNSVTTSSVTMVTRSKRHELTSQDADSTSTDIPVVVSNSSDTSLLCDNDAVFQSGSPSTTHSSSPLSTSAISTTSNLDTATPVVMTTCQEVTGSDVPLEINATGNGLLPDDQEMVIKTEAGLETDSNDEVSQCTMQVLVQLPNGHTVPITIPATINNLQVAHGKQLQQQQQQSEIIKRLVPPPPLQQQQQQHQSPQLSQVIILQQAGQVEPTVTMSTTNPPILPAPPVMMKMEKDISPSNTTMTLKQRLKAQLQSQQSPSAAKISETNAALAAANTNAALICSTPASLNSPVPSPIYVADNKPIIMAVNSSSAEAYDAEYSDYMDDGKRQRLSPNSEDPEERRRMFLERNRAAAARCRQKRKHWIGTLEKKADELQNTNLRLQNDVKMLRGEVAHLKTLLLAHKDCPVTQQQKSSGQLQPVLLSDSAVYSSQELAQVVPNADLSTTSDSDSIHQAGQTTVMAFLSDTAHPPDNE